MVPLMQGSQMLIFNPDQDEAEPFHQINQNSSSEMIMMPNSVGVAGQQHPGQEANVKKIEDSAAAAASSS